MPLTILRRVNPPPDSFLALSASDTASGVEGASGVVTLATQRETGTGTDASSLNTGTAWAANRPVGYTTLFDYGMSDTPSANGALGSSGLATAFASTSNGQFSLQSDATAPISPSAVFQLTYLNGDSGGNGVGNIYGLPSSTYKKMYYCLAMWLDSNYEFNTVGEKLFYWEPYNIICELCANSKFLGFYVGGGGGVSYDPNQGNDLTASQLRGGYHVYEWLVDRTNGIITAWFDGVRINHQTGVTLSTTTTSSEVKLDSTWGGGGTHTRDTTRKYDHLLIAGQA